MEATRADWHQLIRFCVVGVSGVAVNMAVFTLLTHRWDIHHIAAATVSFVVAWTSNFLLNKHWTFRSHDRSIVLQGARNLTVSLVALGLNLVILEILQRRMSEVMAQLIAIAAVTPVNFLLNRRWSFR
jgi:putative flippase GtrA